jgi:hypothetical protein
MIVLGVGLARPITVYLPTEPYPLPS